jgi:HEPN domain-containing protein
MKQGHRGHDWLKQAKSDLRFAKAAVSDGFYSQTCFVCQQASEKALKSVLYSRGAEVILTHSLYRLCQQLKINSRLLKAAGILDQYYLSARYPDALPDGTPDDVFTKEQAEEALKYAEAFLAKATKAIGR